MLLPLLLAVVSRAQAATEQALLRRVAGRDAAALRSLYDRLSPVALSVALRILRARGDAEEVVQDAFVEVWKRADSFDPRRGSATSWVIAIARSRALDRLRTRDAHARTAEAFGRADAEPVALPLERAERREERERIQVALGALPPEQRAVLDLAYFQGLTQAEIAAQTDLPLGTVKTRCRLALEKLATLLAEVAP